MPQTISTKHFPMNFLESFFSDPETILPFISGMQYEAGEIMTCDFFEEFQLCIITEGRFNLYALQENGNQLLMRSCEAIMLVGETELIMHSWSDLRDQRTKDFYIEMLTDCTILILNYQKIKDLLMQDALFLNMLCHSLVEKSMHFADMEITGTLASTEARVAGHLLRTANPNGEWKCNQKVVAEELRMSYRHLHRILKIFLDNDCIIRITGGYRLKDRKKLETYL